MRSRTSRGVPEWSGGKDLYMGSPVLVARKVLGFIGNVPGPPGGSRGSTRWGHRPQRAAWAKCGRGPAHAPPTRGPGRRKGGKGETLGLDGPKAHLVGRPPLFPPLAAPKPHLGLAAPLGGGTLDGWPRSCNASASQSTMVCRCTLLPLVARLLHRLILVMRRKF